MPSNNFSGLQPYPVSLAGSLLAAREAVMAPIRPYLRDARVTEQQWRVLRVLADAEFLDARGISEQAMLHAPTVTRILKELVDRGLIKRQTDPSDARRAIVSITDDGRELVANTSRHTKVLLDAYTEAFGEERLAAFKDEALALAKVLAKYRPGN